MDKLNELELKLTNVAKAQERGDMAVEAWSAQLREYVSLRRQKEQDMTSKLTKARGVLKDKTKRRQEVEDELNKKQNSMNSQRDALGGQVVAGGDLSALTSKLTRLQEEVTALTAGLEVAKQEEADAQMAIAVLERQEALDTANAGLDKALALVAECADKSLIDKYSAGMKQVLASIDKQLAFLSKDRWEDEAGLKNFQRARTVRSQMVKRSQLMDQASRLLNDAARPIGARPK